MRGERGFSLVEVIVATGILVVALVSLAQLFTIAVRANIASRTTTDATVLAQQKVEELRALTWGFDLQGAPVSDTTTDTTVFPEQPGGGTGLSPSPASALAKDIAGFVDYIDRFGRKVGGRADPPADVIYTRRWAIDPLPASPETLVIQVRVMRNPGQGDVNRLPEEARLTTVKTRKPL
jgi:prepilin-type N-terminal cleavage/methylation domain-containing protein